MHGVWHDWKHTALHIVGADWNTQHGTDYDQAETRCNEYENTEKTLHNMEYQ